MVDTSCHPSGIQNFEVAPEKICAHTHTMTTTTTTTTTTATMMKTTATAGKKF